MAKTYWLDTPAGTHTLGGAFTHSLAGSDPSDSTDTVVAANMGGTESGYYEEPENTGVARTSTGSFGVEVNISTAQADTTIAVQLHRVNSSGTIQASSGFSSEQSSASTGLKTFSFSSPALGTWASTDRLAVQIRVTNNATMGGSVGPTWDTGTANSEVTTPFSVAYSLTIDSAAYNVTGSDVSLLGNHSITSVAGAYSYTGQDVTLTYATIDASATQIYDPAFSSADRPGRGPYSQQRFGVGSIDAYSGVAAYNLVIDAGSYSIVGQDISLFRDSFVTASNAAYSISGQDVGLYANHSVVIDAGSYSYTGQDVSLLVDRTVTVDSGAYTYSGQDVTLTYGYSLNIEAGTYSYTGQDVTFLRGYAALVDAGAYTYSGEEVVLSYFAGYEITVIAGAYTYSGQDVSLLAGREVVAAAGSYNYSGQDVALAFGYTLIAEAGAITVSGQDVALTMDFSLGVEAGAYTLNGQDVTLTYTPLTAADNGVFNESFTNRDRPGRGPYSQQRFGVEDIEAYSPFVQAYTLTIDAGGYSVAGQDITLVYTRIDDGVYQGAFDTRDRPGRGPYSRIRFVERIDAYTIIPAYAITADAGNYAVSGQDISLLADRFVTADAGSYTYSGQDVALNFGLSLTIEAGNYSTSGQDVALLHDKVVTATVGSYSYSGQVVGLNYGYTLDIASGGYNYSGQDVSVLHNKALGVVAGAYSYSGENVSLLAGRSVAANAGAYTYSGEIVSLLKGSMVTAAVGAYTYTGQVVDLTYTPTGGAGSPKLFYSINTGDLFIRLGT